MSVHGGPFRGPSRGQPRTASAQAAELGK